MELMKHSTTIEKVGAIILNVFIAFLILPILPLLPLFLKMLDFQDK